MNRPQAVLQGMIGGGNGRVVTIVSEAGRIGEPNLATYCGVEPGVILFGQALAKEVGRHGITSKLSPEPSWVTGQILGVVDRDAMNR